MNNVNRMSEGQHKFLRKVRDGSWLLPELLKWEKVTGMCLTRWLENKFFGRNFDRLIGISTRRSRMELQMAAVVAREMLRRDVKGEIKLLPEDRQKLMEIIDAANRDRREMLSERRLRRKKKHGELDPERNLLHPSFQGREAEFLAAMKRAGTKAGE